MKQIFLCLCCLLTVFACSKDEPTSPGGQKPVEVTTETIGAEGGVLAVEGFSIRVPAGTFQTDTELSVSIVGTQEQQGENALTDLYRIQGIPTNYTKPLPVKLKYSGEIKGIPYLTAGHDGFVMSLGTTKNTHSYFEVTDSSGYLVGELPVPGNSNTSAASQKTLLEAEFWLELGGEILAEQYLSSKGKFYLLSDDVTKPVYINELLTWLELAYSDLFEGSEGSDKLRDRTGWPVWVVVEPLDEDVDGYMQTSPFGDDHISLVFNSRTLQNRPEQAKFVAVHELTHLCQSLSDLRDPFIKNGLSGLKPPSWQWFNESWALIKIAKLIPDAGNHLAGYYTGNEMAPFDGVQFGAEDEANAHGYGMTPFVSRLSDYQEFIHSYYPSINDHFLALIDDEIKDENEFANLASEHSAYLVDLLRYTNTYINNIHGQHTIQSENDFEHTFAFNYPDLSARLYRINLDHSNFSENAQLELSTDNQDARISVSKIEGSVLSSLGSLGIRQSVKGIAKMASNNQDLLVMVINSRAVHPYTETTPITLDIQVDEPDNAWLLSYHKCEIDFKVVVTSRPKNGSTSSDINRSISWRSKGEFNDTTYTGGENPDRQPGLIEMNVVAHIDPENLTVDIEAVGVSESVRFAITIWDYPLQSRSDMWNLIPNWMLGTTWEEVGNYVADFSYTSDDWDFEGYHFDEHSALNVTFIH